MEERFVAAGIDISDDMTQVAYFATGMTEPQMTGDENTENDFLIPTTIFKTQEDWVIGEACEEAITNLFSKALYGIEKVLEDYDSVRLFAIFAEKVVRFALSQAEEEMFSVVTFALPKTDRKLVEAVRKHFSECGFSAIKLVFITHAESCVYYALSQKKELRVNDVAFFDFSKERLIYRKLHTARPDKKSIVSISENDYTSRCSYISRSDEQFKLLVEELFEKQQISTVYLIGEGFQDDSWAHDSINYICNRRRVFKGRNLYALGACYCAMDGYDKYSYDVYCILSKGRTQFELCMEVVFKEERNEAILLPVGELWYDAKAEVEGILHNTDRINLVLRTAYGEVVRNEEIIFSEFPYRKERMTRIKIEVLMLGENEAQLTVKDLGFGEFAVNSGLQVVRNIEF